MVKGRVFFEPLKKAPFFRAPWKVRVEVIGTHVDGVRGTAATPLPKRQLLCIALSRLVRCGRADRKLLEKATGSLIHPFQHRRECNAALGTIFARIQDMEYGVVSAS